MSSIDESLKGCPHLDIFQELGIRKCSAPDFISHQHPSPTLATKHFRFCMTISPTSRIFDRMRHCGIEFVQRLHTSLQYNLLMMLFTNKAYYMFAMYRFVHQLLNPQAMICKCTCEHFYKRTTLSILLDKDRTLF